MSKYDTLSVKRPSSQLLLTPTSCCLPVFGANTEPGTPLTVPVPLRAKFWLAPVKRLTFFKVMKNVSLFTCANQNFALNGTGTVNGVPGSVLAPKTGKQHEVGVKSNWLDGRFTLNVSYFDIQQKNNT